MIGSICDTVVSSVVGPTRSPICAVAIAATPGMSDVTLREPDVELGRLHRGRRGFHGGLRREIGLDVVVELTLRNRALAREGPIALQIALGLAELRLRLGQLRPRLREHRLERPAIDLEEHLALAHHRAFVVVALEQIAGHLRANLRVDVAVERRNPFARQRDPFGCDRDDADLGWRRRRRRGVAGLASREQPDPAESWQDANEHNGR